MSKQRPSFEISKEFEIIVPEKEKAYPISILDWEKLKTKVKRLSNESNIFHTVGTTLLGFAGSALIGAVTIGNNYQICWFLFWGTFIIGIMALYFSRQQNKVRIIFKEDVLSDMDFIEKRFK